MSVPSPTARILLVEDDASLAGFVTRVLEAHGHGVDVVATAEDAERRLQSGPAPSVVLLDINLPGESGWSLFEHGLLGTPDSPPTLVTSASPVRPARLRELNAAGYLAKPYSVEALIQWLNRLGAASEKR